MSQAPVTLTPQEWSAIRAWFQNEERVLRDSYGRPGRKNLWRAEFQAAHPGAFRSYHKAWCAIKQANRRRNVR